MKLVSVIIPYYKKEKFIVETVNSIIQQTYANFEIIIIDDELSETSSRVLASLKKIDKRILILRNNKNIGAGLSRNRGIDYSKGEFIAFCDSDDLWKKDKLKTQINFMMQNNLNLTFTGYDILNEQNKLLGTRNAKTSKKFRDLIKSCDIGLSTVIIKKNLLIEKKLYFCDLITKEDYVLWLKLSKNGAVFHNLDIILSSWRKTDNSLSSAISQKLVDGYRVYRNHLNYGKLVSILCLIRLSLNYLLKTIKNV